MSVLRSTAALRLALLLPSLAAAPCMAYASLITYQFNGTLNTVTDSHGLLHGEFQPGNSFSGTLAYRTDVAEGPTTLSDPTVAIYAAVVAFRVSVNGFVFEGSSASLPGYLQVWDDRAVGSSTVDALTFSSPLDYTPPIGAMGPGTVVGSANLNLFDFTHSASRNGTNVPTEFDLSQYGSSLFSALQLNVDNDLAFHLNGRITSFSSVSTVPEPTSLLLVSVGAVFLLMHRRSRGGLTETVNADAKIRHCKHQPRCDSSQS